MTQIKRHLINSESFDDKTKKLRTTLNDKSIIRCFESLPNELYYEIFDYLEGCQLYEAFSNLNTRFQTLLSSYVRLKIKLNSRSEEFIQNQCTHIVIPNKDRIFSFSIIYPWSSDANFPLFTIDSSFSRLESLRLSGVESNEFIPLLVGLINLPRLFSLTIYCDDEPEEMSNVYQIIFNMPMLKYNQLTFFSFETVIPITIATNDQFSSIETLIINHCCAIDELMILLSFTPQLCRLSCRRVNDSNHIVVNESLIEISTLTRISFDRCFAEFDDLETFITKISPQLQVLRITCSRDASYLDPNRWERIISHHLRHLNIFEFKYEEIIDGDLEVSPYHSLTIRFNSLFWTKRKWIFRIYIDTDFWEDNLIIYSILPYRESQVHFHENDFCNSTEQNVLDKREIVASSMILSETHRLTVIDHFDIDEPFIDIIGPILILMPVTYLNILRSEIFIGTLIDLLNYLPNLDSLVISSLAMLTPRCLFVEESLILRLVSNNNKITKVNLQRVNDLAQIQFLLDLCPRMKYFEVNCTGDVSAERIVRFISMKNIKYVPNLSSLCLYIPQTDENVVEKLKQMIDLEQLYHQYTIKQIDSRIYLEKNL